MGGAIRLYSSTPSPSLIICGVGVSRSIRKDDDDHHHVMTQSSPVTVTHHHHHHHHHDKKNSVLSTFHDDYLLSDVILGTGARSIVKLCQHRITSLHYAVKIIIIADLLPDDLTAIRREALIMKHLHHDNIISYVDYIEDEHRIYLLMENMAGGQLLDRILQKSYYTEHKARNIMYNIIDAVKHCHDHRIIHRDLKIENILLCNHDDDCRLKIADFGFAIELPDDDDVMISSSECGTIGYIAPEILEGRGYGVAVDMWSVGVICYILLAGYPPFCHQHRGKLFKLIKRGSYHFHHDSWRHVSDDAKEFVRGLLVVDAQHRFTAQDALQHRWLCRGAAELQAHNLSSNMSHMVDYQSDGIKRFRAAAQMIIIAQRWQRLCNDRMDDIDDINDDDDDASIHHEGDDLA